MTSKLTITPIEKTPLLEVEDFSLTFRRFDKGLHETETEVIRNLNLTIDKGEVVAIVGASGSGKSLLANAVVGILPKNARAAGMLKYKGQELTEKRQTVLRGKEISLIPQSVNALDPLMRTGKQVQDAVKQKDKLMVQQAVFRKVGLSETAENLYPFELSGGMARRVLAATAIVSEAELIIADEPTPGLDPAALHDTLKQMKQLVNEGKGMMFITHDIETALNIADRIVVFRDGQTVEVADAADFTGKGEKLKHPYTRDLWNALPQNEFSTSDAGKESGHRVSGPNNMVKAGQRGMLEVKNIGYHYPDGSWLFKDLTLSVSPGEVVGIFGYSGSGKSTMAQIISGYKSPLRGQVLLGSSPISSAGIHPIQLVWQHPEKAINPRWRMRHIFKEVKRLDEDLLNSLGIREEWFSRRPSELSGGELQRFCLARSLAGSNIRYLIADEMTTMLDALTQAQIWEAVLQWAKERSIGILAVSHDHHLLNRISDRVLNFPDIRQ